LSYSPDLVDPPLFLTSSSSTGLLFSSLGLLFDFLMKRMLPAKLTIFFDLYLLCLFFLIPCRRVIPSFALRTLKRHDVSDHKLIAFSSLGCL